MTFFMLCGVIVSDIQGIALLDSQRVILWRVWISIHVFSIANILEA
jgi:hypothetical protein